MNVFIGLSIMVFGSLLVYTFITTLLGIVVVIIAVPAKNQRLGDIIAGTVVVNTKTKLSLNNTVFM